jgi:predicted DNA-binding protein YlxM (UPF0122 family)
MQNHRLLAVLISLITLASCSGKQISQAKGIQKHEIVLSEPTHSYEIYLPAGYDSTKTYPVIFSFDSHGSGSTAIAGFKQGADTYGFIIVGSNLIRNGIPEYDKRISALVSDVKNRFAVDNKALYTAGFSGSARMANYFGLQNQFAGIISCGAGFRQKDVQSTGVDIYIYNIAGTRDCNYGETAYLPSSPECLAEKYISVNFTGIHEWPSTTVLTEAIKFMYARLIIDKIRDENTVSLSSIMDDEKRNIDSVTKMGNKLALYKSLEKASKIFAGKSEGKNYTDQMTAMDKDAAFIESLNTLQQALQMETMLDQGYIKAMTEESLTWWKTEFKALNDSTQASKKGDMIDMMFRAKAYIGMVCFSFTSSAAKKKDIPQLEKMLSIYEMAEPKNPDVFYYKAYSSFLKNEKDSVFGNMKKAYELGFEDSVRLQSDFPAEIVAQLQQKR